MLLLLYVCLAFTIFIQETNSMLKVQIGKGGLNGSNFSWAMDMKREEGPNNHNLDKRSVISGSMHRLLLIT